MATSQNPSKLETKLETALAYKEEGNALYKAKEYNKAARKYHNAILYMKGIDNDLHGTPAFLQSSSVNPNSDKKISKDLEEQCIKANIAIYNNLEHSNLNDVIDGTSEPLEYYSTTRLY